MKRQRGRNRRNNNNNSHGNSNRSLESNGPDVKVRGTAKQIFEKYEALASDAASSGNRVKVENYRQHAEHYLRIVNAIESAKQASKEEIEAARPEQSSDNGKKEDSASSAEKQDDGRSRRRYPPQARKSGSGDEESKDESSDKPSSDPADLTANDTEVATVKKSPRRRKAPSRKATNEEDTATEAAE